MKTLGATLAGGVALAGSGAVAGDTEPDKTVSIKGFNYTPRSFSIDVSDGPVTVKWVQNEEKSDIFHDVNIAENRSDVAPEDRDGALVSSELKLFPGDTYEVTFDTNSDGDLLVDETGGLTGTSDDPDPVPVEGGSISLTQICSHHAIHMYGSIDITTK